MPCDHVGPHELIEMAEAFLRERGETAQDGRTFRWSENPDDGMWKSVVLEIERRDGDWIVTRIDRNPEKLPGSELGLRDVTSPERTPANPR